MIRTPNHGNYTTHWKLMFLKFTWCMTYDINKLWTERNQSSQDHGKPPSVWLQVALNFHCFLSHSLSLSPGDMLRHVRSPPCLVTALTPVVIPTLSTWMQRQSGRDQWCRKEKTVLWLPPTAGTTGDINNSIKTSFRLRNVGLNDSATLLSKRPR